MAMAAVDPGAVMEVAAYGAAGAAGVGFWDVAVGDGGLVEAVSVMTECLAAILLLLRLFSLRIWG